MPTLSLVRSAATLVLVSAFVLQHARAQCSHVWTSEAGYPGANGSVRVTKTWDPDGAGPLPAKLVLGGTFTALGTTAASLVATWDPATGAVAALGSGMGTGGFHTVAALEVLPNGDLVAAGLFTTAGGTAANNVARWNGTSWSALGTGITGAALANVASLAVLPNGDLVAGGTFTAAGGVTTNNIARWDGTSWSALGSGMAATSGTCAVYSLLTMPTGELIAGGRFTTAGGIVSNNTARWDGASWAPLGGGIAPGDHSVSALALRPNGHVVAGGNFPNKVWVWDGATWSLPGVPMAPFAGAVNALETLPNGDVLLGGQLWWPPAGSATNVVRWDGGTTWSALAGGLNNACLALETLPSGDTVAGGSFTVAGAVSATHVARWNGTAWSTLIPGWDGGVAVIVAAGGSTYVGGTFQAAAGVAANRIARFDGTSWSALGTGLGSLAGDRTSAVTTLPNGDVIAGGVFGVAGGVPARNVARWNGTAWSAMGAGVGTAGQRVNALAVLPNGDVVAGGFFTGGNVARWNGTVWSPLGAGTSGEVFALAVLANGDVVAGGSFGLGSGNISRWDGTTWSPMGTGLDGYVSAMTLLPAGELVVCGQFATAGGVSTGPVARWNGAAWSAMGAGVQGVVAYAVTTLPDGDVLLGGAINAWGGSSDQNLVRWDGAAWSATGAFASLFTGGDPAAFGMLPNGELLVAGSFTAVGGLVSPKLVRLASTCPAGSAASGAGCAGSGGASVLSAATLPWVNATFRATGTGLPANALVLTLTSVTPVPQGVAPLSLVFSQAGPGCDVLVAPDILGLLVTTTGIAQSELFLVDTPPLVGVTFFHQMVPLELDVVGAVLAVTATNALQLTAGAF